MMRSFAVGVLILGLGAMFGLSGCGMAVKGPRFWWDDQKREKLADGYALPSVEEAAKPAPAAEDSDRNKPADPPAQKPQEPATEKPKTDPKQDSSAGAVPKGLE